MPCHQQRIKPSNVFVRDDDLIVLGDFESSFRYSSVPLNLSGDVELDGGGIDDEGTEKSWSSTMSNSNGPDHATFVAPEVC